MINLKKLFAAAMAMAMVATVAPVKAETAKVLGPSVCAKEVEVLVDYVDDLAEVVDLETVKAEDKFTFGGTNEATIELVLDVEYKWDGTTQNTLRAALADLAENAPACMTEEMAYLAGYEAALDALETIIGARYKEMFAVSETDDKDPGLLTDYQMDLILAQEYETAGKERLELLTSVYGFLTDTNPKTNTVLGAELAYLGNLDEETNEMYDELVAGLEEGIETLSESYGVELSNAYVKELEKYVAAYGKTVTTEVNGKEIDSYVAIIDPEELVWDAYESKKKPGTTATLEAMIEAIEEDKAKLPGKYEDNEDVEEVVAIMEGLEALLEVSEELDNLVDDIKALDVNTKLGTKDAIAEAELITGGTYSKKTTWATVFADASVDQLFDEVNPAEFEMLVELMEAIEEFRTIIIKETRSGYTTKTEWSDLGDAKTNMPKVFAAAGVALPKLADLEKLAKDEKGNEIDATVWETLVDHMEEVVATYETIVEDIKGITVNNLNSKNVDKVVAAYEALETAEKYFEMSGEDYAGGNWTEKEVKAVEKAAANIQVLYLKALFNGVTTEKVTGWVELGNGNWDYYGEDGNLFTGWVAAGSNWYYVSNGHMLRNTWVAKDATGAVWYYLGADGAMVSNTVVDGYAINANGEWVK